MKMNVLNLLCFVILLAGCKKKEPPASNVEVIAAAPIVLDTGCGSEILADKAIKVSGTDLELPVGTKFCVAKDHSAIQVELPAGYSFGGDGIVSKAAPVLFATYTCNCSGGGNCQVVYSDDLGFGCMHNNCTGNCTGYFTYKGYSLNRLMNLNESKEKLLSDPDVRKEIAENYARSVDKTVKQHIYGLSYYFELPPKASCDCGGTKACTLKVLGIRQDSLQFKIYYCEGTCNNCELTI